MGSTIVIGTSVSKDRIMKHARDKEVGQVWRTAALISSSALVWGQAAAGARFSPTYLRLRLGIGWGSRMATDKAVRNPSPMACPQLIRTALFRANASQPMEESQTPLAPRRLGIASTSAPVNGFEIPILHRAHEPQECFTWGRVESVANTAALVSPAAPLTPLEV
jgi:hypothetical protein